MRKTRAASLLFMLFILLLLFMGRSVIAAAEARSIYVGDLINIRITTREFTREEIMEKFKDFEIVKLEEEDGSFIITLRTFEPGERKIRLGDKELIIDVRSTLDEIERDDVFEGSLEPEKAGMATGWQYLLFLPPAFSVTTGAIILARYLKKRRTEALTPYQRFLRYTGNLTEQDDDFFVKLTFYLKQYLEEVYSCRIRGKTSSEILAAAGTLHGLQPLLEDLEEWLRECDRLKFSGVNVSREKKQELQINLTDLVRRIEAARADDSKENDKEVKAEVAS